VRVVIAEDTALLREGLAGLLEDAGHEVAARVGDAETLLAVVAEHEPDLAVVDVRMPPTYEDEGLSAAVEIRRRHTGTAVLVLSQHIESRHVVDLVGVGGFGYLLKDRVLEVDEFLESAERVARGGSALDPEVVRQLVSPRADDPLSALTQRELWVTEKTVETHVGSILGKLGLPQSDDAHRRVLAVLAFLRSA
jgi:DNA-binding NarL/FixJ family response regulator